jgi:hypothetical protein
VRVSRLAGGSAEGKGLKINVRNADDTADADGMIMYHPPGSGHHVDDFPEGYFKVSSGKVGTVRLGADEPTGALVIPGDDTDGFGHTLPGNFDPEQSYNPLTEEPPVISEGIWGELESNFADWWDHGGLGDSGDDG